MKGIIACADVLVLNDKGEVLLTKRAKDPFMNTWILPGGHIKDQEIPEDAAIREVFEETRLSIELQYLYGAYGTPQRDPRSHSLSVVYVAKVIGGEFMRTVEVSDCKFFSLDKLPENIGFDHAIMLEDFRKKKDVRPLLKKR